MPWIVQRKVYTCGRCNGERFLCCKVCHGAKQYRNSWNKYITCSHCGGEGYVPCPRCEGGGRIIHTKSVWSDTGGDNSHMGNRPR